jgi:hypothetical protein
VWGWVSVCGSHSPPLDADRDRQTGEHLSPWRGIWCGTQLNTMRAHGIPWRCPSVRDKPTARARAAQDLLGALARPGFGYAPAARDRVEDRQQGLEARPEPSTSRVLHCMRYPFRWRLNRPFPNPRPRCLPQHQIFPEPTSTRRFLQVPGEPAATPAAARPHRAAAGPSPARSGPRPPATAWRRPRLRPAARTGRRTAAPGSSPGSRATPGPGPRDTG